MAADQTKSSDDIDYLLSQLTDAEKVSLLSGADDWHTVGIERLGIGALKVTDGPAGARGQLMVDGPQSAFLPAPVLQAATWCRSDLKAVGRLLCREMKTKSAQILAAPTICCARNPLGGRNFEAFSEDPFLSGALAIEYVAGLQQTGEVVATAKHLVANEQETERFTVDSVIDEQTLREIYLRPFESLIKSSSPPGCVMTAYNLVNGQHMDEHAYILRDILRTEWKFDGLVMSDWGGTNSTVASVLAGCDLEMPGPPVQRGHKLLAALESNPSTEFQNAVGGSCRRLLTLAKKMNLLGLTASQVKDSRNRPERSATSKADLQSLREIVANGHVLLKNSAGTLPLSPSRLPGKKVAFVGPNAKSCTAGGGGSASMNPQYQSQPLQAFQEQVSQLKLDVEIHHAQGAYSSKWLPLASSHQWSANPTPDHASDMLRVDFYAGLDFSGPIIETQYRNNSSIDLTDSSPACLRESGKPYCFRVTTYVTPDTSGCHQFSLASVGNSRLIVDGQLLVDNYEWTEPGEAFYAFSSAEKCASVVMTQGKIYPIILEAATKESDTLMEDDAENTAHVWSKQASVRLGYLEELSDNMVSEAVELANACDYTVVVVGLSDEWESEGYDRRSLSLPGNQNELIETMLEHTVHPENVIVVNQSGSPVEMPWATRAHTILQSWYGGQEAGYALADVLLGLISPSGRLPVTWPKRYSDLPFEKSKESWPGVEGRVHYKERTGVGYRWYLRNGVEPQWWFGHGLSYTSFSTRVSQSRECADQSWEILAEVENTGSAGGRHVVQIYSWPCGDEHQKELRSFEKTEVLAPHARSEVRLQVKLRDMAYWREGRWTVAAGDYVLGIGESAGAVDIVAATLSVPITLTWDF
ncbi:hypothetical protein PV08_07072 [Exophiala spinifera]|uniref:beta-glucosidase n=1 Tax=Exophiala spinifera TaxID=91928 RepID=A0A0D2B6G8_9EURO|nr:uncharacterized protein PV08_07072 [Exophiala spinifera]KIW14290.1 hypothetical protein PV08_07072 [Exophiala spinifera]